MVVFVRVLLHPLPRSGAHPTPLPLAALPLGCPPLYAPRGSPSPLSLPLRDPPLGLWAAAGTPTFSSIILMSFSTG